jgi:hypothetical protein
MKQNRSHRTGDALHAQAVQATPLEARAILDLVMENIEYAGDSYYRPLWQPVEKRVAEFHASMRERTGK